MWFVFCCQCCGVMLLAICRNLLGDDVPVIVLLSHLRANGWCHNARPQVHTESSPKHFGSDGFVDRRHYLQCLVHLESLRLKGLTSLRSDRPKSYYAKVLSADSPETVIDQSTIGVVSNDHDARAIEHNGVDSDDSGHVLISGRPVKRRRLKSQHAVSTVAHLPHQDIEPQRVGNDAEHGASALGSMDTLDIQHGANAVQPIPSDASLGPVRTSSPSSSSSTHDSSSEASDAQARTHTYQCMPSPYSITLDEHGTPGEPGHYRRLCIKCPLAGCAHFDQRRCQRYRNMGPGQSRSLGPREAEFFLMAWADAADRHSNRTHHMRFTPSPADVRAAARSYGQVTDIADGQ